MYGKTIVTSNYITNLQWVSMFADACEKAMKFTRPVIISTRSIDGSTTSGCAAFVVINRDGWFMTAGHVFDSFVKLKEDKTKIDELESLNQAPHSSMRKEIKKDPKWITNQSFWWGWDGIRVGEVYVNREIDIAVGRFEGFKSEWISEYPIFKDPSKMRPGTSLCRIGFPFIDSSTDFDEKTQNFRIRPGVLPMAFFPNDGIHTRNVLTGRSKDGDFEMLYVETSTPGLKGQSGGPIFDRNCNIAGLQVRTAHMPLGFSPSVQYKGDLVVENQFMNVGIGIHVKTLLAVLDSRGVKYACEGDDQGFRIVD